MESKLEYSLHREEYSVWVFCRNKLQQRERQEEEVEKEEVGEEKRRTGGEGEKEKEEVEEEEEVEWEPPAAVGAGPRKGNIPFYTQLAASPMNQTSDFEVRRVVHVAAAVMTSITELKLSSPVVTV